MAGKPTPLRLLLVVLMFFGLYVLLSTPYWARSTRERAIIWVAGMLFFAVFSVGMMLLPEWFDRRREARRSKSKEDGMPPDKLAH